MFKERGELLLLKFADRLKDVGAWKGCLKWKATNVGNVCSQESEKSKKLREIINKKRMRKYPFFIVTLSINSDAIFVLAVGPWINIVHPVCLRIRQGPLVPQNK
jgi:hypothetical protein